MSLAVEVSGLVKEFPGHTALSGIDFSVPQGSVYGFLGPNGAGKTTTIKILLGLIGPTRGQARVLGHEVRFGEPAGYLSGVGYLPQDPVFPEGLSGIEVLELVADIYGMDRIQSRQRIGEVLEEMDLSQNARRRASIYSRGMKQRLGLASVLLTGPDLLILDEPVSALDPQGRKTVLETLRALQGKATVFLSSHILADVERVCDRVAIVDQGQKLMEKDTRDILREYAMEQYVIIIRAGQEERARELLSESASIREVEPHDNGFIITSHPGQAGVLSESVIPMLVGEGILVEEFMRRRVDLEDVFFRVIQRSSRPEVGT